MKSDEVEEIIKEYRESRQQIRKIIKEYEEQEMRLFKVMLDRLQKCEEHHRSLPSYVYSEHLGALD